MALAAGDRVFWGGCGGGRVIGVVVKRYGMQLSFSFSFFLSIFLSFTLLPLCGRRVSEVGAAGKRGRERRPSLSQGDNNRL